MRFPAFMMSVLLTAGIQQPETPRKSAEAVRRVATAYAVGFQEMRRTVTDLQTWSPVGVLEQEQEYGEYRVRTYREVPAGWGCFEILRSGQRVYAQEGVKFQIGGPDDEDEDRLSLIPMGKDVTGDGVPDVVVFEWTGGAHCCFSYYVFQIGKECRLLGTINAEDGYARFVDVDGDGNFEVFARDWIFAYWRTSFAESPAPEVILRYQNGAYRLAADLMRKATPASSETAERARKIRQGSAWPQEQPPPALWGEMLDLIYSGHMELAWQFLDMAWKPGVAGKDAFLNEFRAQLAKSPYWSEIQELNQ